MGLLDYIVNHSFRDESAGRVVVFPDNLRHRAFLVKSEADELKIKSFLKMFYFGHFAILLLGMLLANAWSMFLTSTHLLGRPATHMIGMFAISFSVYALVTGVPYWFLRRAYKKSIFHFVSTQDEVTVTTYGPAQQKQAILAVFVMISFLIMGVVLFLLGRAK